MGVIQIRGVSDEAHERLKVRAAQEGKSLSEYLRAELEQLAATPRLDEILDLVAGDESVDVGSSAELIRAEREAREARLARE